MSTKFGFSAVLDRKDLMVNHDRYGLFRPTSGVQFPDGIRNKFSWKTTRNLHLDVNPWTYVEDKTSEISQNVLGSLKYENTQDFIVENNEIGVMADGELQVQGLINLADNRESDGGFHLVPGFNQNFTKWVESTANTLKPRYGKRQTFIVLPEDEPAQSLAVRITARAGSMIIWNQTVAHGSDANDSNNIRYAQFLKIFRAIPSNSPRAQKRRVALKLQVEKVMNIDTDLTELGQKNVWI